MTSRQRAATDARWVTLTLGVVALGVAVVGAVELARGRGTRGCTTDSDCPPATAFCDAATSTCVGCDQTHPCADGEVCTAGVCAAVCQPSACATGKCAGNECACTRDADCPAGRTCIHGGCAGGGTCSGDSDCSNPTPICAAGKCVPCDDLTGCPTGMCIAGSCVGPTVVVCDPPCAFPQACDPATLKCVCDPSALDRATTCAPAVGRSPYSCTKLAAGIADAPAVAGQPDLRWCTGVQGTDVDSSGYGSTTAPWSIDQIYVDHFDSPTLRQSFPGTQPGVYDSTKVAVVNTSGCESAAQAGDVQGTNNCSRGARMKSLLIGPAGAAGPQPAAAYDETRDISSWQAVGDTFFAAHKIWGDSPVWTTGGTVVGNVYPRPTADPTKSDAVRMRMTGDLWNVDNTLTSSDGVPLVPGLRRLDTASDGCNLSLPSVSCGGSKYQCTPLPDKTDGYCAKVGKPVACFNPLGNGSLAPTCVPVSGGGAGGTDACLLQTTCEAFLTADPNNAPVRVPPLAWDKGEGGAGIAANAANQWERAAYGRTGGCLTSKDLWGPGQYEFTLIVPPVPHDYDRAPVAGSPNVDLDKFCLPGFVFALWNYTTSELYSIYEPYDPSPAPVASGAVAASAASAASTAAGAAAAGPRQRILPFVPPEQGTWSGKVTNTCGDQDDGGGTRPVSAETAVAVQVAGQPTYFEPRSTVWSAQSYKALDWLGPRDPSGPTKVIAPTCVPTNSDVGGGAQGSSSGAAESQDAIATATYHLLGCDYDDSDGCAGDADCAVLPNTTCQTVAGLKRCMPTDGDLKNQLTAYYAAGDKQTQYRADNCQLYTESWQTGLYGLKWCGAGDRSLSPAPCAAASSDRWRRQVPSADIGRALPVPETPWFAQAEQLGADVYNANWGGNDVFSVVNPEIDIEIPANTPTTAINAARAGGEWGSETMNVNTWLADNNSYTATGDTPWYTQSMVSFDTPDGVPPVWTADGISAATCDSEYRAKRSFVSKPTTGTPDVGQVTALTPVKYMIDWWADEDPTKSYVKFSVDGREVYSTTRFVPTRAVRWILGMFPARWGRGTTNGVPNAPAYDYVYVDLLAASFRPYNERFTPPGRQMQCLKIRAMPTTYDQQLRGVTEDDITGAPVNKAAASDPDTEWQSMTCRKDQSGTYDCEIRCGIRSLVDYASDPVLKTVFPSAHFTPSDSRTLAACTQKPVVFGLCPGSPPTTWAGAAGAAAAGAAAAGGRVGSAPLTASSTSSASSRSTARTLLIAGSIGVVVMLALTVWMWMWSKPAKPPPGRAPPVRAPPGRAPPVKQPAAPPLKQPTALPTATATAPPARVQPPPVTVAQKLPAQVAKPAKPAKPANRR